MTKAVLSNKPASRYLAGYLESADVMLCGRAVRKGSGGPSSEAGVSTIVQLGARKGLSESSDRMLSELL